MRKEIVGILLFFCVIFTLISLVSYHHTDPSVHNAGARGPVNNLFGPVGAQVAGVLVGVWGLGAFWVPVLLLLACIHFFSHRSGKVLIPIIVGGLILLITTGSLLALRQNTYDLVDRLYSGHRIFTGGLLSALPIDGYDGRQPFQDHFRQTP